MDDCDQITINIIPDQNVDINAITLNQGVVNHSVTHQSGGSDELLHNLLGGLQGGSGNGYYHLSSGQYFNLTTGEVVRPSETGIFYTNNNPSGFITGVDLSSYATIVYTTGISGGLQDQIIILNNQTGTYITGSVVRPNETGIFITNFQTGQFYANSNPSGFITGIDLSAYSTITYVTGVSGELQNQITEINSATGFYVLSSETGIFYTNDNPSGFITGVNLSSYTTIEFTTGVSGNLQNQINILNNQTGSYVLDSETGNFITAAQTGGFYPISNPSGYITGDVVRPSETGNFITTSQTGQFYASSNPSGFITGVDLSSYVLNTETGNFITTEETGIFYPRSNPSGYITGVDLSFSGNYYTKDESESRYVNTTGAETILGDKTFHDKVYINNLYVTGLETIVNTTNTNVASNFIMLNLTGGAVDGGLFFVTGSGLTGINDSGAIIGFDHSDKFKFGIGTRADDLSTLNTIASEELLTGASGYLQTQIITLNNQTGNYVLNTETGNFITTSQTGQFYSNDNPSGFITGVDLSAYVLNSETGIFITNSQTGAFYSNSNPSGFITGVDLSSYSTIDYVTGVSGDLQAQITNLDNSTGSYVLNTQTGSFITTSETGNFYSTSNPSGFITGISDVVYTTGNQTINDLKDFTTRPTVNGTGVLLSGEGGGGGSVWTQSGTDIYYNDGNVGIGTSTPTATLEVNGTAIIQDDTIFNGTENTMPNQTLGGGEGSIITKAIGDVRYLDKSPVTNNTLSHTIEQFEDFDKQYDPSVIGGTLFTAAAFGSPTIGTSHLFGNYIDKPAAWVDNDQYTWNGAMLIRGPSAGNQVFYIGLSRCLNMELAYTAGIETTFRIMLLSAGTSTGYFKVGVIPWGGTGAGDQSLRAGLLYSPVLFGNNNLYIAATIASTPFTFTTTLSNVNYVDTGFDFSAYFNQWINITYKQYYVGGQIAIRYIIKRDAIIIYDSGDLLVLNQAPYNTWSNRFSLYSSGASRKVGIQLGNFTYTARQSLYIDYIHEKVTKGSAWNPPSNWNELRF